MRSDRGSASQRLLGPVRSLLARQGKPPAAPGRHHELTPVNRQDHLVETVRDANSHRQTRLQHSDAGTPQHVKETMK
jgi:hypothetical protein